MWSGPEADSVEAGPEPGPGELGCQQVCQCGGHQPHGRLDLRGHYQHCPGRGGYGETAVQTNIIVILQDKEDHWLLITNKSVVCGII